MTIQLSNKSCTSSFSQLSNMHTHTYAHTNTQTQRSSIIYGGAWHQKVSGTSHIPNEIHGGRKRLQRIEASVGKYVHAWRVEICSERWGERELIVISSTFDQKRKGRADRTINLIEKLKNCNIRNGDKLRPTYVPCTFTSFFPTFLVPLLLTFLFTLFLYIFLFFLSAFFLALPAFLTF